MHYGISLFYRLREGKKVLFITHFQIGPHFAGLFLDEKGRFMKRPCGCFVALVQLFFGDAFLVRLQFALDL